mmetsp:Transcript_489/g.930  ORF Transcript_489/g.930 Transcript_489/m.930 type:complete len:226 (-) Transcript_489:81-758(-)
MAEADPTQSKSKIKLLLDKAKQQITLSVQKYRDIGYMTHSMLGKALASLAKICFARGEHVEADEAWKEALSIFKIRMGHDSLYVAGALKDRLKVLIDLDIDKARKNATPMLKAALEKYALKQDVIDLKEINEILGLLLRDELQLANEEDLQPFVPLILHCDRVLSGEIRNQTSEHPNIDVRFLAEFYQHAGHLLWLSKHDNVKAKRWVQRSVVLWGGPDNLEEAE